jgi:hypothetical protein
MNDNIRAIFPRIFGIFRGISIIYLRQALAEHWLGNNELNNETKRKKYTKPQPILEPGRVVP